jgi:hypothetical protein
MLLSFVCGVNLFAVMNSRVRALYKIDPRPEGPAQARQIIAEELSSRLPARVVDDIKLTVSELVTNGIAHGAGRAHHRFAEGGFGLMVIEQLADRWGMQHSPQQTEVWFERQCA